jgi:ribosomal protein S14
MLRLNRKQSLFRGILKKIELKQLSLQIIRLKTTNLHVLEAAYHRLYRFDKKNKKIGKIRNLCFISSRMRGTYRYFKLSRMFIRELGNSGFFMGMRKTSF